ncbi:hypothetical protein PMAYCL1PPCAC_05465, partial [Pristionchus mayeri]
DYRTFRYPIHCDMSASLWRSLHSYLCIFVLLSAVVMTTSALPQIDPKLRAILESDPKLMAELQDMIDDGTFPGAYERARLFNYHRLG